MERRHLFALTIVTASLVSTLKVAATGPSSTLVKGQPAPSDARTYTLAVHQAAIAGAFTPEAFRSYINTLPRDGEYFLVEGDIALTEQELLPYLVQRSSGESRADQSAELLVNTHEGRRDFYADPSQRRLAYVVLRESFPNEESYRRVVESMAQATSAWEGACPDCGLDFAELPDGSPASFSVRYRNAGGAFIARAFFPHDPPDERFIDIDPSYLSTTFDQVGVLRHELGHVLGYRHEHIRGIPGCFFEGGEWLPLTEYDPHSVMHYFCGGGGGRELELSELDQDGHRRLYGPASVGPPAAFTAPAGSASEAAGDAQKRYEAAVASPFDEARRVAFLDSLPEVNGYYLVEGDMRMTEEEILPYLVSKGRAEEVVSRGAELLVNVHLGTADYYRDLTARRLRYAVDRASFAREQQYRSVVEDMRRATEDWQSVCRECKIEFSYASELDGDPTLETLSFIVRLEDSGGSYIAAAFFPHDPPSRRVLSIDPSYFTTSFDRTGVLRHELGHVLGYRHEHIRGIAGCYREDGTWNPITPYDPKSVMHYFCGGGGSLNLEISPLDEEGHRKLYGLARTSSSPDAPLSSFSLESSGAPQSPALGGDATLVIRLEGGDVVESAVRVLSVLRRHDLLETAEHAVSPGETVEGIYRSKLGLPGYSESMTEFANSINPNRNFHSESLSPDQKIHYPNAAFATYTFAKKLDREDKAQLEQINQNWGYIKKDEKETRGALRVTFTGYELRVRGGEAQVEAASRAIDSLGSRNIVVEVQSSSSREPSYFCEGSVKQWWESRASLTKGDEADLGCYIGMPDLSENPERCTEDCPEIVLIDQIVALHPDVAEAIVEGGAGDSSAPLVAEDKQRIEESPWSDKYHGTHLAGIVASRRNGFGLVGVHPRARVRSWDWSSYQSRRAELVDRITQFEDESVSTGNLHIYVLASHWVLPESSSPEGRFTDDILSRKIEDEELLVIAAAGQPKVNGENPVDIGLGMRRAPVHLGASENVVVVTACSDCLEPQPRLMERVNYSTSGLVHLAAPGDSVLGPVNGGKYTFQGGTSQATAFVAGVVSSMVSRFPNAYQRARDVKRRLFVTARPFVVDGGDEASSERVAAGVVDPKRALLDPKKDWLAFTGENPEARKIHWLVDTIEAKDSITREDVFIPTSTIYRVIHDNGSFVFFVKYQNGVRRVGPLELTSVTEALSVEDSERPADPWQEVGLNEIEDLLLSHARGT